MVIGAHIAWQIKTQYRWVDPNNEVLVIYAQALSVVGAVPSGLDIFQTPQIQYPFGEFLGKCIPLAIVVVMESYSVARRVASKTNTLHILNPTQEMCALGSANLIGCVTSALPVSGIFSRTSLNYLAGCRTVLSLTVSTIALMIVLTSLTDLLYFIPKAALSAILFTALYHLLGLEEIAEVFMHSKTDFFILLVAWGFAFFFDSEYGIYAGIGLSIVILIIETVLLYWKRRSLSTQENIEVTSNETNIVKSCLSCIKNKTVLVDHPKIQ